MAIRAPDRGDKAVVEGEVANSSDNVVEPLGIITLVIDKTSGRMTTCIKNMEMLELRYVCQKFSKMVDDTILEIEINKIKQKKVKQGG